MGNHSLVLSGATNRCRTVVLEWSFNMRKGNIIAGLICAAVAVYVIVTCLGYPRAEVYGTGVPGPGLWPGIIAALLLICSVGLIVVTLMMKKDQFPKAARYRFDEISEATGLPEGARREYDVIFGALFRVYQDPDAWEKLKGKAADIAWTIERIAVNRSAEGRLDLE